eukprot:1444184-Pyramimonas_sp.AAC.1
MSAASSDDQARRSRSHARPRDDPHPHGRLPREGRQAAPSEHAARRGGQLLACNDPRRRTGEHSAFGQGSPIYRDAQ